MSIRGSLVKGIAKTSQTLLKILTSGGSSFPGKLAKKLDPRILGELAKDYDVVIITGTNGKTMTTSLTVNILRQHYPHVLTNDTGSNLEQGILSTFIGDKKPKHERALAVLEVDEASVRHVTEYIQPKLIVATNIFRDQMDRYGEIYTIYDFIREGAEKSPQTPLLMNGDAPIFSSEETSNPRLYFGFGNQDQTTDKMAHYNTDNVLCPVCDHLLHYHMITYSNLGDYFCPNCGFHRPDLAYAVTSVDHLTPDSASFTLDNEPFDIPVAGIYNIYNALAAYAIARFFDVPVPEIRQGFETSARVFGRQEVLQIAGKQVRINLIKNPVGFNQIVDIVSLQSKPFTLVTLLNDRPADGQDVSWIWDGNFEALAQITNNEYQIIGGLRVKELRQRMIVAGFSADKLQVESDLSGVIQAIKDAQTPTVNVLTTYTAMLDLRKALQEQGIVKERMHA
ncbi:MAG: Mur ligase family protein [Aerococcus sp.]|nr:Mur ligase family protein [Aerococcus sp.]